MHITYSKKLNRGFTLIEIIVAVSIFALVMTMSVGAILSIVGANKKANALNSVITSLNGAFESMVRDLRTGRSYQCGAIAGSHSGPQNCASGATSISFISSQESGNAVGYSLGSGASTGRIIEYVNGSEIGKITPTEVVITDLKFYVSGSGTGDSEQPRIIITLKGYSGFNERTKSEFSLQTLVTQRQLDI